MKTKKCFLFQRSIPFGFWVVLFFMLSWMFSLVTLYFLLPTLRGLIPTAAFALFASTALIAFSISLAFYILKASFPFSSRPVHRKKVPEQLVSILPPDEVWRN
ncbi:MAG: hypothetical protein AB1546_10845 [bacterium]